MSLKSKVSCKNCSKNYANEYSLKAHLSKNICNKPLQYITGKKYLDGSLTNRLGHITNITCYNYIVKNCFNSFDILSNSKKESEILPVECREIIKNIHQINSSIAGIFLDYLLRRLVSEEVNIPFTDERADKYARNSREILNVVCNGGDVDITTTNLPLNMMDCYNKVKDVANYKTENLLVEIFITSLSHTIFFGGKVYQNIADSIINLLQTNANIVDIFLNPLKTLCFDLLKNNTNVLLNPCLTEKSNILLNIPADCDLIINNTLYDIKCTGGDNSIKEILQLMGYSSLINCNPTLDRKIDTISIINLLQGTIVNYNISSITKEQMLDYLRILTRTN
jgi:hypothetical protein